MSMRRIIDKTIGIRAMKNDIEVLVEQERESI